MFHLRVILPITHLESLLNGHELWGMGLTCLACSPIIGFTVIPGSELPQPRHSQHCIRSLTSPSAVSPPPRPKTCKSLTPVLGWSPLTMLPGPNKQCNWTPQLDHPRPFKGVSPPHGRAHNELSNLCIHTAARDRCKLSHCWAAAVSSQHSILIDGARASHIGKDIALQMAQFLL